MYVLKQLYKVYRTYVADYSGKYYFKKFRKTEW